MCLDLSVDFCLLDADLLVLRDFALLLHSTPDIAAKARALLSCTMRFSIVGSQANTATKMRKALGAAACKAQLLKSGGIPRELLHWRQMVDGLLTSYRWFDDDGGGAVSAEEITEVLSAAGDDDTCEEYAINAKERARDPLGDGLVRLPAFVAAMIDGCGAAPWMKEHPLPLFPDALPLLPGISQEELVAALDTAPGGRGPNHVAAIEQLLEARPFDGKVWGNARGNSSSNGKFLADAAKKELCQRFKTTHLEAGSILFDVDSKLSVRAGTADLCIVLQGSVELSNVVGGVQGAGTSVLAHANNIVHTFNGDINHLCGEGSAVMAAAQVTRCVFGEPQVPASCLEFMKVAERLIDATSQWLVKCSTRMSKEGHKHDLAAVMHRTGVADGLTVLLERLDTGLGELELLRQLMLKRFTGLRLKGQRPLEEDGSVPADKCSQQLDMLCAVRHACDTAKRAISDLKAFRGMHTAAARHHASPELYCATRVVVGKLRRGAIFGNLAIKKVKNDAKPKWPVGACAGADGCTLLTVSCLTRHEQPDSCGR